MDKMEIKTIASIRKILLRTAKVMQRRPHRSSLWWRDLRGGRVLHLKCILFFIKTEFPY